MAGCGGAVMSSWSRPGSCGVNTVPNTGNTGALTVAAPASEEQKPGKRRRVFCLSRIKPRSGSSSSFSGQQQQHLPANNNNNMPFIIHCPIGKEIKHICSNCRGAEEQDGEETGFTSLQQGQGERGETGGGGGGVFLLCFKASLSCVDDRSLHVSP